MDWRKAFIVAMSGCAVGAHASFELLLVGANNGTGIHRYDGDTGAYFGSFGGNMLSTVRSIAVDKSRGRVYALSQNTIKGAEGSVLFSFNYHTGEYLNDLFLGFGVTSVRSIATDGAGNVYVASGATINRYSPDLALNLSFSEGLTSAFHGLTVVGNRLFARTEDELVAYSLSGGISFLSGISMAAPISDIQLATDGNRLLMGEGAAVRRYDITTNTFTSLGTSMPALSTTVTGVGFGHANRIYQMRFNSTSSVSTMHVGSFASGTEWGNFSAANSGFGPMATVIAPEPGTFIAVGAGVLAFLRRRRKA